LISRGLLLKLSLGPLRQGSIIVAGKNFDRILIFSKFLFLFFSDAGNSRKFQNSTTTRFYAISTGLDRSLIDQHIKEKI